MFSISRQTAAVLACAACLILVPTRPAGADGAASTRNIIFGGALVGGTLLILNHNKKVHERYAEDARRQADLESQRNDAQAAYESERSAYLQEAALVSDYKREVAYQHGVVQKQDQTIRQLRHQVALADPSGHFAQPLAAQVGNGKQAQVALAGWTSYGWGSY